MSLGVLKLFERTGKISLESLLKLAFALDALAEFEELFRLPPPEKSASLEALLQETTRQRGRT